MTGEVENKNEVKKPTFKKAFKLKCFYPATKISDNQSYKKTVNADRFWINNGVYMFAESNGNIIACYPVQYTIIEEIIVNE